jgi:hypothetical protein
VKFYCRTTANNERCKWIDYLVTLSCLLSCKSFRASNDRLTVCCELERIQHTADSGCGQFKVLSFCFEGWVKPNIPQPKWTVFRPKCVKPLRNKIQYCQILKLHDECEITKKKFVFCSLNNIFRRGIETSIRVAFSEKDSTNVVSERETQALFCDGFGNNILIVETIVSLQSTIKYYFYQQYQTK